MSEWMRDIEELSAYEAAVLGNFGAAVSKLADLAIDICAEDEAAESARLLVFRVYDLVEESVLRSGLREFSDAGDSGQHGRRPAGRRTYEVVYRADSGLDPLPTRETMDGESALSVAKAAAETVDESVAVEVVLDGEVAATAFGGEVRGTGYVVSVSAGGKVLQEDLYESRIEAMKAYDAAALGPSRSKVLASVALDEEGDYDCLGEIMLKERS